MLRVMPDNVEQKRTLRPLYAQHQATPYGGFLDPNWDKSVDIYPGMVMKRVTGEVFSLYTGDDADERPFGLSTLFVAPDLGIDETRLSGTNVFSVWRGGPDAVFEILAPAFAESASWSNPTDGRRIVLGVTETGHTDGPGKLAPMVTGDGVGTPVANVGQFPVALLIDFVSATKIVVAFDPTLQGAN